MNGVIRWEAPRGRSADARRAAELAPAAEELQGRPGDWAVIHEGTSNSCATTTTYVKQGRGPFAPKGSYEATSKTSGGKGVTYARYVGGPT